MDTLLPFFGEWTLSDVFQEKSRGYKELTSKITLLDYHPEFEDADLLRCSNDLFPHNTILPNRVSRDSEIPVLYTEQNHFRMLQKYEKNI